MRWPYVAILCGYTECCLISYLAVNLETKIGDTVPSDEKWDGCLTSHTALLDASIFTSVSQSKPSPIDY